MSWTTTKFGANLLGKDGNVETGAALAGKDVVGLYFSAHWCPPCRGFTPVLGKKYQALKEAGKSIEIIFVSSDRDQSAFDGYYGSQPWLALPFAERTLKNTLSSDYGVRGIPTLVLLDGKTGDVITTEGRGAVSRSNYIETFPWTPQPLNDLSDDTEGINDKVSLVVAMEKSGKAKQDELSAILKVIATTELAKDAKDRRAQKFFTACGGGPIGQIRTMCAMTVFGPQKHQHDLKTHDTSGNWGCDGCRQNCKGQPRFRCSAGCDFDYCGACNDKANAPSTLSAAETAPTMLILNLGDRGAYYNPSADATEVTAANIENFLNQYQAGDLARRQFGANQQGHGHSHGGSPCGGH